MLLVIFGAGASWDASPDQPLGDSNDRRVPLAAELFGRGLKSVADDWPAMTDILPFLRYPRDRSIELVLDELRTDAKDDTLRASQLMAVRFYIHHAIVTRQHAWLDLVGR